MRLYTMPLCRHFMLVLYTKVYTRFMPRVHRLALYQVDLQVVRICNINRHLQNHHNITRFFINPSILSSMFSLFRSEALRVPKAALASRTITSGTPVPMSSVRPWWREVFSGTFSLMNSVLPVCLMLAYAMALFRFMLVLCNARGLSWLCLGPA